MAAAVGNWPVHPRRRHRWRPSQWRCDVRVGTAPGGLGGAEGRTSVHACDEGLSFRDGRSLPSSTSASVMRQHHQRERTELSTSGTVGGAREVPLNCSVTAYLRKRTRPRRRRTVRISSSSSERVIASSVAGAQSPSGAMPVARQANASQRRRGPRRARAPRCWVRSCTTLAAPRARSIECHDAIVGSGVSDTIDVRGGGDLVCGLGGMTQG
jgi:hypothetical protein